MPVAARPSPPPGRAARLRSRRRWTERLVFLAGIVIMLSFPITLAAQAGGSAGATAADALRATIGPGPTAQVEGVYLGVADAWQQVLFRTGIKHVAAPWKTTAIRTRRSTVVAASRTRKHVRVRQTPRPVLVNLAALIKPALPGEGVWTQSVAPASPRDPIPLIAKAFIRPDPARPYAIATILRFDLRHVALHLVAGTIEPGGPVGMSGSGIIPAADQQPGRLLAAFNGGFKYADGAYGMMVDHTVYVQPIPNAATLAITTAGHVFIGSWGHDPRLTLSNTTLVSWRQNGLLLIDHGKVNPLAADDGAWGTTVLNSAYTWRSAVGMTKNHALLYVAGNALSVTTLARALREAGAQTAMELDINPFWVRAFFYGVDPRGHLTMANLRPDMEGNGYDFLGPYTRDFFYVTRIGRL